MLQEKLLGLTEYLTTVARVAIRNLTLKQVIKMSIMNVRESVVVGIPAKMSVHRGYRMSSWRVKETKYFFIHNTTTAVSGRSFLNLNCLLSYFDSITI